jgi:hypothetical protein
LAPGNSRITVQDPDLGCFHLKAMFGAGAHNAKDFSAVSKPSTAPPTFQVA